MKDLGYKTIGFGKWNIGHCNEKYLPSARGFDHFIGYLCPGHGYVNHNCGNKKYVKDMIEGWTITDDDGESSSTVLTGYPMFSGVVQVPSSFRTVRNTSYPPIELCPLEEK